MSIHTPARQPLLSAYDRACNLLGALLGWTVTLTVIVGVLWLTGAVR